MIRPPFMARVAAGLAVTVVEETRKLPTTAVMLPMTSVSLVFQTGMRVQQTMTSLAIKGDQALSFLYPDQEQPSWAVFDEDHADAHDGSDQSGADGSRTTAGRFALYSTAPKPQTDTEGAAGSDSKDHIGEPAPANGSGTVPSTPEIAEFLDYDALTLAQLRARLRTLSTEELTELLDYEKAGRARAPFVTMLGNRITSTTAK
ncbi:lipid droplet-associated protein [Rhodococcus sp. D2-41]|uniref:Lipid droplet-associated protein n=1 Tax=Speluncibacter jeojiensis TaxID=2710754 RepID=A0A9X4RDC7_9ACTN|nr:lipid droplet-associated protein [Rhodococcus sp. D2-41]MDG3012350.1 lipid droplet-associated protein [Rhodococcus sp. D2-41]MDG3014675.1 lipid droplet-associated protein [Corynebacteriales bacterium D3-21]